MDSVARGSAASPGPLAPMIPGLGFGLLRATRLEPESFDLIETGDRLVANFCLGLAAKK